jgi:hypothetical protein
VKQLTVLATVLLLAAGFAAGKGNPTEHEMLVKVQATRTDIPALQRAGLYIYEVGADYVRGAILPSNAPTLTTQGFRFEVLIPDMVKYAEDAVKPQAGAGGFGIYHTYQQIMDSFAIVATNNPGICHLDTIGQSPTGKYLIALKITQNPNQENHRPRMLWDGTTHGNENIGTEACWYYMQVLVGRYGTDPLITQLVNTREIWLIPCVNPEGLISRSRGNSNGIDLNRDYGYAWNAESGAPVPWSQPEIRAFRDFMQKHPFVITNTYHSGTESVMWPWSYSQIATKDSVCHKELCDRYSTFTGYASYQISRGLYECQGTSSDFTHGAEGALGVAAEIGGGQPPPQGDIDTIAHANWSGSKDHLIRGAWGIRGAITDSITGAPVRKAIVAPNPPDWMTFADSCGWYFKYARPGNYSLKVMADGYVTKTISGITVPTDTYVTVNVPLQPDTTGPITGYKVVTWVCKSPSGAGSTMGFWTLGRRDTRILTLTTRGTATIEMSRAILNGAGTDFTVYSTTSKPCTVLVSEDEWNGPWHFCAYGSGNISCDLANAGVSLAHYVRLNDAGSSYDLDAIEATVVNAPALAYNGLTIIDSTGNSNGRLDPGEAAQFILSLRNAGRQPAANVSGRLHCASPWITVDDSLGAFGTIAPDSVRNNNADRFAVTASAGTPRGTIVQFTTYLQGTGYSDSVKFDVGVGQITSVDPIPDGPRTPPRYYAYDDVDAGYPPHPTYQWVEIKNIGTRLTLSDDQTAQVTLPSGFGPWKYYGSRYTQVSICSNGWVAAGSTTSTSYQNAALPTGSPAAPIVCLCWDDLNPPTGQGVWYYHDAANHRFVVEYDSISHYSPSGTYEKFELIILDTTLAAPTGDNVLLAQYLNAVDYSSVTVGLQDPTQAIAIQDLYNGAYHQAAAPIAAGRAIKYCAVEPSWLLEERTIPVWNGMALAAFPNPMHATGSIQFMLRQPGKASLKIYDASGRLVRSLLDDAALQPGAHTVTWNRRDDDNREVNSGIYFIKLVTEDGSFASKAILLK